MKEKEGCMKILRKIQASKIEEDELGKAKSFRLFSIARPHMRSFHASWFCFFVAFTSWFGIQPLIPTIRKELGLTKIEVSRSGTASIAATIAIRVIIGPLCDKLGPRITMASLLISGSIPMALAGLVKDGTGLIILRLFVGILGGSFVPCQFWTTAMFNSKIVGTANAIVGGWGNLGGGFTFIIMPALFELIKVIGADDFLAWKIAVAVPAAVCVLIGEWYFNTLHCRRLSPGKMEKPKLPEEKGHASADPEQPQLREPTTEPSKGSDGGVFNVAFVDAETANGTVYPLKKTSPHTASATLDKDDRADESNESCSLSCGLFWKLITIVIFVIQYGMCFGVEISVNTVMNLYFLYRFKIEGCEEGSVSSSTWVNSTTPLMSSMTQTSIATTTVSGNDDSNKCSILNQNTASLIASLFGLMNLFARALGGIFSDVLRKHLSLQGRILAHFITLTGEGIMLIIFSQMDTIPTAIAVMIFFSLFVQMSEGTTYAIVPYLLPKHIGIVAGIVGAGGNAGALVWTTIWSTLVTVDPSRWFWLLGIIVLCGSALTLFVVINSKRIWNVCVCHSKQNNYEVQTKL